MKRTFKHRETETILQRAVWRNGGSNPAENDVRTRTEVARRTCSESRRCAKPPSRWLQGVESVVEKVFRTEKVV